MNKQFKLMVLANAVFVLLYFAYDWVEYSSIQQLSALSLGNLLYVTPHFPWQIQYVGNTHVVFQFDDYNFTLLLFLLATFLNLYIAFKLQRSKETKPNAS
jgi:hypothetical protein